MLFIVCLRSRECFVYRPTTWNSACHIVDAENSCPTTKKKRQQKETKVNMYNISMFQTLLFQTLLFGLCNAFSPSSSQAYVPVFLYECVKNPDIGTGNNPWRLMLELGFKSRLSNPINLDHSITVQSLSEDAKMRVTCLSQRWQFQSTQSPLLVFSRNKALLRVEEVVVKWAWDSSRNRAYTEKGLSTHL